MPSKTKWIIGGWEVKMYSDNEVNTGYFVEIKFKEKEIDQDLRKNNINTYLDSVVNDITNMKYSLEEIAMRKGIRKVLGSKIKRKKKLVDVKKPPIMINFLLPFLIK